MKRYLAVLIILLAVPLAAQQAAPKPRVAPAAPQPPAAPQAPVARVDPVARIDPEAGGQPINIRLDVSVVDQIGGEGALPKTIMVMLVDRALGRTRAAFGDRSIAVDAQPRLVDGRIRVYLTIQSDSTPAAGSPPDQKASWRNSFSLLLENGKPIIALENSDAATKRNLSIEVKATLLK